MSRHPAPDELLLDYAAGALAAGPALAVSLHVALDPAARRIVGRLEALGGLLMEGEGGAPIDEAVLQRTLARLDDLPLFAAAAEPAAPTFAGPSEVELALTELDLDGMSPREAMEALYRLRGLLK